MAVMTSALPPELPMESDCEAGWILPPLTENCSAVGSSEMLAGVCHTMRNESVRACVNTVPVISRDPGVFNCEKIIVASCTADISPSVAASHTCHVSVRGADSSMPVMRYSCTPVASSSAVLASRMRLEGVSTPQLLSPVTVMLHVDVLDEAGSVGSAMLGEGLLLRDDDTAAVCVAVEVVLGEGCAGARVCVLLALLLAVALALLLLLAFTEGAVDAVTVGIKVGVEVEVALPPAALAVTVALLLLLCVGEGDAPPLVLQLKCTPFAYDSSTPTSSTTTGSYLNRITCLRVGGCQHN